MKQKEFAAFIGVRPSTYSSWVNDGVPPTGDNLRKLAEKLQAALSGAVPPTAPDRKTAGLERQVGELQARRSRLEDGYLAGLFSLQSFTEKLARLDQELAALSARLAAQSGDAARREQRAEAAGDLTAILDALPDYIQHADPQAVNRQLHLLLEGITLHENGELTLEFL